MPAQLRPAVLGEVVFLVVMASMVGQLGTQRQFAVAALRAMVRLAGVALVIITLAAIDLVAAAVRGPDVLHRDRHHGGLDRSAM